MLLTVSNLFASEVVQIGQHCQLCVLREKSICSVLQAQHVTERCVPELMKQRTENTFLYTAEFKCI